MPTNPHFRQAVRSEQTLYEDIIIESLKMYGQDLYYLPRTIVNEDRIFGDDVPSRFNSAYKIEMYIENIEGFEGEGDLFSRFGVEIRDEATFIVSRKRWRDIIGRRDNEINSNRPREGDLVYIPLTKSMFEIMHVEHEQPFYQLGNLPLYKMRCTLFEYNDEDLDTGVSEIDVIEQIAAYRVELKMTEASASGVTIEPNTLIYQYFNDGTVLKGEITRWSETDRTLYVSHIGAENGEFKEFTADLPVRIEGINYNLQSIVENNRIDRNTQSDAFDLDANSFLDFTETNPFGEPEL